MIFVFWTLTSLSRILSASGELPQPVNMVITSKNFIHIVTWEPGPGTPADIYYQIRVNTDVGTSWVPVTICQHVRYPLVCNMTEAFSDSRQVYITQITAKRGAQASRPLTHPGFCPIKDTHLDLPVVAVTPCGKNLCVDLMPKMLHLWKFYSSLSYQLKVESSDASRTQFFQKTKSLKGTVLQNLAPSKRYCISVQFSDSFVPRESNYSQHHCAITPGIYTSDSVISAVLCVMSIAVIIIVILLNYTGFLCLRKIPLPSVLTSIHHIKEVQPIVPHNPSSLQIITMLHSLPEEKDCQTSDLWDVGTGYEMRLASNLLSSSSSSPVSSQSGLLSNSTSNAKAVFLSGNVCPLPQAWIWSDTHLNAASKHSSPNTAALSDDLLNSNFGPIFDQALLTAERIRPIEVENWEDEIKDNQDVNLCSVILGRYMEEEEEKDIFDQSNVDTIDLQENDSMSVMLSETWDTKKAPNERTSCSDDEEQQNEQFLYMRRTFSCL